MFSRLTTLWRLRWTTSCCLRPHSRRSSPWTTRSMRLWRPSTAWRPAGSSSWVMRKIPSCSSTNGEIRSFFSRLYKISLVKAEIPEPRPEDDDGRYWQSWGREKSWLLLSALGQRVRLQVLLTHHDEVGPEQYWCSFILRYFYGKIQQKRAELDSSFGVRNG